MDHGDVFLTIESAMQSNTAGMKPERRRGHHGKMHATFEDRLKVDEDSTFSKDVACQLEMIQSPMMEGGVQEMDLTYLDFLVN